MLYFKHSELSEQFHVSLRTVHNWISSTREGKLELTLYTEGDKAYVANTPRNISIITQLIKSRRKYRNTNATKTVTPSQEFYSIYGEKQIYDIATNLEIHHEIPRQYNYFNNGADAWDVYIQRLATEDTPNIVNSTVKLLKNNLGYLDSLFAQYKCINVIDVGVGNAYPVKEFLEHLLHRNKLGRYIALDISSAMLDLAKTNISQWFGGQVVFEGHEIDINYDRFSNLLIDEYVKDNAKNTLNLVLLLGGTLSNMRTSDAGYKIIHDSMGINDLLIHATKLDTRSTRDYFDFGLHSSATGLAAIHSYVIDLMNIDKAFYAVELGYDSERRQRFEQIRLKKSLVIKFNFKGGEHLVELNKGDVILTWRALQQTAVDVMDQFERNDFYPLHTSQTDDQEYILTVSRVKRG